jgi:hypothetical protein
MRLRAFFVFLAASCCLLVPTLAHAGVPQWPQTRPHATASAKSALRKASRPPKRDRVHQGGVDGSIALIQFISTRRQHDQHLRGAVSPERGGQVRASSAQGAPRGAPTAEVRAVNSLPSYHGAIHLSI